MILKGNVPKSISKTVTVGESIDMSQPCKLYVNMIAQYNSQLNILSMLIADKENSLNYLNSQLSLAGFNQEHIASINDNITLLNNLIQDYKYQRDTLNSMLLSAQQQLVNCLNINTK